MVQMNFSYFFNDSKFLNWSTVTPILSIFRFSSNWPWLLSLFLVCFIARLKFYDLPALRQQNSELENMISIQESSLVQNETSPKILNNQNLAAQLPKFERLSHITKDLHTLVEESGLSLSDATFKPTTKIASYAIKKMDISVHLKGGYLPLKNVVATLLTNHEGLALDFLSAQRNRATDLITDFEIRFSFYYQDQQ